MKKKYKILFWIGFTVMLLQIILYFVIRFVGMHNGTDLSEFNWSPELIAPAYLMMIVGTIGVCSYHRGGESGQ